VQRVYFADQKRTAVACLTQGVGTAAYLPAVRTFDTLMCMTALSESDRLFVERRRARKHVGLFLMPVLLVVLLAVWASLFVMWPLAVNPKAIWGAQESGVLTCGSGNLSTYATSAAVLVNVAFALLSGMLLLRIGWSRHERRLLRLIDKATLAPGDPALRELPASVRQ
jgi:hypothetical protein